MPWHGWIVVYLFVGWFFLLLLICLFLNTIVFVIRKEFPLKKLFFLMLFKILFFISLCFCSYFFLMWWNFNSFNGKEDFYSRGKNMLISLSNLLSIVCLYLVLWKTDDYCAYLEWDKRETKKNSLNICTEKLSSFLKINYKFCFAKKKCILLQFTILTLKNQSACELITCIACDH